MANAEDDPHIEILPDTDATLDVTVLNAVMKACLQTSQSNAKALEEMSKKLYSGNTSVRQGPGSPIKCVILNSSGAGKSGKRAVTEKASNTKNKKCKTSFIDPGPSGSGLTIAFKKKHGDSRSSSGTGSRDPRETVGRASLKGTSKTGRKDSFKDALVGRRDKEDCDSPSVDEINSSENGSDIE
jgi:hypothetical protein